MTNQTQTLRLIDFHNRVADFKMKGTYGYVEPSLRERGFAMLTAESYVEELVVTDTKVFDSEGNKLPSPVIEGVDKYGRAMVLPIDRILAVGFCDTEEQGRLKSLTYLMDMYGNAKGVLEEDHPLFKDYKQTKEMYQELLDKGVTIYQRKG
jgi:hypothetical protein